METAGWSIYSECGCHGDYLSAANKLQLWVPEGFAHGFIVLGETAESLYTSTHYYALEAPVFERCFICNDSDIGFAWPTGPQPLISTQDQAGQPLTQAEVIS